MKSLTIQEKLIHFQNISELNFQKKKTVKTSLLCLVAMLVFMCSTIIAAFTMPFRLVIKLFKKKDEQFIYTGNSKNIDELLNTKGLLLIDFWAEWCGPCVLMNSVIEEFAQKLNEKIKVIKVNADLNPELLKCFGVRGLPQFILLKDQKKIKRHAGPMTKYDLKMFCSESIKS